MNKVLVAIVSSSVLIAAILATSGCATIVKGSSQGVTVKTDPEGASCDLAKKGKSVGVVNPTPGTVQLGKGASDVDVTCRKSGYFDAIGKLSSSFQGWTLGNALIGGVVGIVIDAGSGAMHEYQPEIFMTLTPESFASNESREAYFDDRRAKVLKDSEAAKAQIAGKCTKDQCESLMTKAEDKTQEALAQIESDRKRATLSPMGGQTAALAPAARIEAPSPIPPAVAPMPATAVPDSFLKVGDRWKYNFTDRGRAAGSMTVEIVEANGRRVRERITREGYRGFAAEREVDTAFSVDHFQTPVALPGGYQLSEISPYLPPGTRFKTGQMWDAVPGSFFLPPYGKKTLVSQVRIAGQETIRVPAGTFLAWKIEANSADDSGVQNIRVKVKCTFWYAPELKRTIRMVTENVYSIQASSGTEYYELASFEPGR